MIVPFVNQLCSIHLVVKDLLTGTNLLLLSVASLLIGSFVGIYPGAYLSGIKVLEIFNSKTVSSVKLNRVRSVLMIIQYAVSVSLLVGVFTVNS
jgi:putative ABC transport system permease protein